MAKMIMIKPSSGDTKTSLFTDADSSQVATSVDKGTMLKVVGTSGNYYMVEYDNGEPNVTHGGTGMTGTIVAHPYVAMYDDEKKSNWIGNVNNGTTCKIVDDTHINIISIEAVTTEGTLTGFVDAKYIYRDNEPTPQMFKMTRNTTPPATSTGVVTAKSGLKARDGAGVNNKYVGAFNYNASLTIHETKNGYHKVSGTSGWGTLTEVWVSASYVNVTGSNPTAAVSKTDATPVPVANEWTDATNYQYDYWSVSDENRYTAGDEYYKRLADKYMNALGAPPKFNMDIDVQYNNDLTAGGGRVMNKTVLSNPAILSICPGTVKMFPNVIGSKRDTIFDGLKQMAYGNQSLYDKIVADEPAMFSGKLYEFQAATKEYALYLNALCRSCAIMLGIGDKFMPHTRTKLKEFDYSYWSIRKKYTLEPAIAADNDKSIFRKFWDGLVSNVKSIATAATDNTAYINFFLNGSETSVTDSITNGVTNSPLSSVVDTISSAAKTLNYFSGGGFDVGMEDVHSALNALKDGSGDVFDGIVSLGKNFMNGGQMVLPKMLERAEYAKNISCNMKFMSPYGDKYSVFLKCIVPICHLLAMALPKQQSDNMYTYPFLVKCIQPGSFNIELGIISSLTITKGGNDETSYTIDSIATEWEVQMEITPLVDELMMTNTTHPVLFCKNEALLGYLANFCGFDAYAFNLDTKAELAFSFIQGLWKDIPGRIENKINDSLFNLLNPFFTM